MLKKSKVYLIMFLCVLSSFSIGFASWSIQGEVEEKIIGNVDVQNVVNSKDYIYLDTTKGDNNSGIDWFDYEETAYLNDDGITYNDTGYIDAFFIIDIQKCKELFGTANSIQVKLTLKYLNDNQTDLNIFVNHSNKDGRRTINNTVTCATETFTSSANTVNRSYVLTITFDDILLKYAKNTTATTIPFNVQFALFATTGPYFNNNIYKYLEQDNIDFALGVEIQGIE